MNASAVPFERREVCELAIGIRQGAAAGAGWRVYPLRI
jgi:hypothetical protein